MTETKDLFDGEYVGAWKEDGVNYVSFANVTIALDDEDFENFKKDMKAWLA